jgi:hypothetical protein
MLKHQFCSQNATMLARMQSFAPFRRTSQTIFDCAVSVTSLMSAPTLESWLSTLRAKTASILPAIIGKMQPHAQNRRSGLGQHNILHLRVDLLWHTLSPHHSRNLTFGPHSQIVKRG